MKKITEEEVRDYFLQNGHVIINANKVEIRVGIDWVSVRYLLEEDEEERFEKYELYEELSNVQEFVEVYHIGKIEDLQMVSKEQMWKRYLQEKVEVIFTNGDDHSVHFRPFQWRTMVYSRDLNWYEETNKEMNKTEHFREFVDEHWDVIEGMSYKR